VSLLVSHRGLHFPFSALSLLVGLQERHPARKTLGVGLLVVMIWLEICTSYSSNCRHSLPPSPLAPIKSELRHSGTG